MKHNCQHYISIAVFLSIFLSAPPCTAQDDPLPRIIGIQQTTFVRSGESLMEIARRTGQGFNIIANANPQMDPWIPESQSEVQLPLEIILPEGIAPGITVNLAELRLFHINAEDSGYLIRVYPLGIGRSGRETPEGQFKVVSKQRFPAWRVPKGLRELDPELPEMVPPGPSNPLGDYWLGLSIPGYGIHGTNRSFGVGRRVSYGCLRMYPEDIADLFADVEVGTEVFIVYQPVKLAWKRDQLFMEVHPDYLDRYADLFQEALHIVGKFAGPAEIDYKRVRQAVEAKDGTLYQIGQCKQREGDRIDSCPPHDH